MKKIIYIISTIISIGIIYLFSITYNNSRKEMLQNIINYQIKSKDSYTPNSYYEYITALDEAKTINDKFFASKEDITKVTSNLQTKIDNLYIKPDKTILKNKYKDAINVDLDLYLPNSTLNIKNAINNAYTIIKDDNAIIEDVNNAINNLDESLKLLIIKPDKTVLNDLITKAKNIDKNSYTTITYNNLNKSIQNAYSVIYDNNATQSQVNNTVKLINDSINNLVIANKRVYKITYNAYMLSNNHVGNEWSYSLFYNSKELKNRELITANMNSNITIWAKVYEYDKIMDYGSSIINLILKDGYEATTRVTVRENCGRYYGNTAIWEIKFHVKLVETIS